MNKKLIRSSASSASSSSFPFSSQSAHPQLTMPHQYSQLLQVLGLMHNHVGRVLVDASLANSQGDAIQQASLLERHPLMTADYYF
jgi:hypothetical protein